jgi:hypothetical protein
MHVWRIQEEFDDFILKETEIAKNAGIELKRPFINGPSVSLVAFTRCENVRVEGISVRNSPFWSVHVAACRKVLLKSLRIESSLTTGVNSDGIDIDGCQDVLVTGCVIATGDDAICLKSTKGGADSAPCEDVVVENCKLTSTSCALKIGTETFGDFRRIVFRDCEITDSNRGLGIFVRDGATVSDVVFTRIKIACNRKAYNWWGDGDPIRFVVLKRNPQSRLGSIRNVTVSDVFASGQGSSLIAGFPETDTVSNITLRNVHLTLEAEATVDKRATHGLVLLDVADVALDGVRVAWDKSAGVEPGWGKPLHTERATGLKTNDCRLDVVPR